MTEWIAVITITLLAVISPGPDFAMVTRNSLLLSRRAGMCTALGIGGGVLLHVTYTLVGVGLLIQQSLWLFRAIQILGAVYLVYLGLQMLRAKRMPPHDDGGVAAVSDGQALRMGFWTNALNPKTTVFIVSLFMQVVHVDTPLAVQLGYGLFIAAAHIAWFALVAQCVSAQVVRQGLLAVRHWVDRIFGGVLVALGCLLGMSSR